MLRIYLRLVAVVVLLIGTLGGSLEIAWAQTVAVFQSDLLISGSGQMTNSDGSYSSFAVLSFRQGNDVVTELKVCSARLECQSYSSISASSTLSDQTNSVGVRSASLDTVIPGVGRVALTFHAAGSENGFAACFDEDVAVAYEISSVSPASELNFAVVTGSIDSSVVRRTSCAHWGTDSASTWTSA